MDGDGFAAETDCDDENAAVNPDAAELCDGIDNNCDGEIDDPSSLNASTWYTDADEDGFGDVEMGALSCERRSAPCRMPTTG